MVRKFKSMDGNNAAAYVSYAFTEVAGHHVGMIAEDVQSVAGHGTGGHVGARCSLRPALPVPSTVLWQPAR